MLSGPLPVAGMSIEVALPTLCGSPSLRQGALLLVYIRSECNDLGRREGIDIEIQTERERVIPELKPRAQLL